MERELGLHRERIELAQTIHDTTAQTAYMIGLGIHRARTLGERPEEGSSRWHRALIVCTMWPATPRPRPSECTTNTCGEGIGDTPILQQNSVD